ncbi:MAG: L-aspartate oxidase [Alphaproteobacteria bacterium]|nr:L-aspartate oxidase [Alphaproteobacteria bacterium]
MSKAPIIIIGAGIAGLSTALRLAPHPVTVLTGAPLGEGSASAWAQGGIAAALSEEDTPSLHVEDTIAAGAGLVDEHRTKMLTEHASEQIAWLEKLGVPFDRQEDGNLSLGREAAHSKHRIVHAGGDGTGAAVMRALIETAKTTPSIHFHVGWRAVDIAVEDGAVVGIHLARAHEYMVLPASAVVLATGGVGQLYCYTTNPLAACGEGLAMAARAGAELSDLEFVQFHPTALAIGRDPMPLLTEALRGAGAILINENNERFMTSVDKQAELAPRDVVARAIWRQLQSGHVPMLDARQSVGELFPQRFPLITAVCESAGLNPVTDALPVAPAAHYHMGGVSINDTGHSTIKNLWVCGETACSRIHGANRLASNSLLEALVYGQVIAKDVLSEPLAQSSTKVVQLHKAHAVDVNKDGITRMALRKLMYANVGLVRNEAKLLEALKAIVDFQRRGELSRTTRSMILIAGMVTVSALQRKESRGAHAREDFPNLLEKAEHSTITLALFERAVRELVHQDWPKEVRHD